MVAPNAAPLVPAAVVSADATPAEDWDLDQLGQYAAAQIGQTDSIEKSLPGLIRKSVVSYYRAGMALFMARQMLKETGEWCAWQKAHKLPRNSALTYLHLYERAKEDGGEAKVATMTLKKAKALYKVGQSESPKVKAKQKGDNAESARPVSVVALVRTAAATLHDAAATVATSTDPQPAEVTKALTDLHARVVALMATVQRQQPAKTA